MSNIGLLDQWSIAKYARSCAARAGLNVVWERKAIPRCDGTTIFLPTITSTTTEDDVLRQLHYVAHEVGHILHSDFNLLRSSGVQKDSVLMDVWNILEDHRINYHVANAYEGDRANDDKHYSAVMGNVLTTLEAQGRDKLASLLAWEKTLHGEFAPTLGTMDLSTKNTDVRDKLGKYTNDLRKMRENADTSGTSGALELAKRIVKEVFDEDPDTMQGPPQETPGEGGGGKKKDGAGEKGKDKGKGKEGTEGGKSKDGGEKDGDTSKDTKAVVKYEDLMGETRHGSPVGSGLKIDYSTASTSSEGYTPTPPQKVELMTFDKSGKPTSNVRSLGECYGDEEGLLQAYKQVLSEGSGSEGIANKVRANLQIKSRARTQFAQKKGKLHGPSLHRLLIKDSGGYGERIFKNKLVTDVLDVSIALLVDTSGSMSGPKYAHAMNTAVKLSHILGDVLHVPTAIYGFSTYYCGGGEQNTSIGLFRKFSDVCVPEQLLAECMATYGSHTLSDNPDGEAIVYVRNQLLQQRTKRKVMFVLSDGSPAASPRTGSAYAHTKEVIAEIEKRKDVELYAIGIMDTNVTRLYKKHYVIKTVSELEPCLLSLLNKTLLNN